MLLKHGLAGLTHKAAGGGGALTLLATDSFTFTSNASNYTFSAMDIGTASATRVVYASVWGGILAASGNTTATIGGVTATQVTRLLFRADDNAELTVFKATVPTGTTADVVVTYPATYFGTLCMTCSVDGVTSEAAVTYEADPATGLTMDTSVTNGDILIVGAACVNGPDLGVSGSTQVVLSDINTDDVGFYGVDEITTTETKSISSSTTLSLPHGGLTVVIS